MGRKFIEKYGEINTISGNINWMSSRSNIMKSPILKDEFMKVIDFWANKKLLDLIDEN